MACLCTDLDSLPEGTQSQPSLGLKVLIIIIKYYVGFTQVNATI